MNGIDRKHIFIILFVCLAIRALFFAVVQPWEKSIVENVILESDSRGYDGIAQTLLHHGRFAQQPASPPEVLRTPGYPVFIAFVYLLFGESPWIVILLQIILDVVSCLFLFLAVARLFPPAAGFASLFYAVDPFLVLYSNLFFSETLLVFFLVLGVYFIVRVLADPSHEKIYKNLIPAAVFWGCAALTKPIAGYLYVPAVAALVVVFYNYAKKLFVYSALFIGIFFITLSPWLARNTRIFGKPVLSVSKSLNMLILMVAPIKMEQENIILRDAQARLLSEAEQKMNTDGLDVRALNDFQKAPFWEKTAKVYIKSYPGLFIKYYAIGLVQNFWGLGTAAFSQVLHFGNGRTHFDPRNYSNVFQAVTQWILRKTKLQKYFGLLIAVYLLSTYILLVLGLRVAFHYYPKVCIIFVLVIIGYFLILTGSAVSVRFKVPIIPFYYIFSGLGIYYLGHVKFRMAGK
ncbi:glycosyltransferase family 39 protein [candidate division KSB1 bacterium]|nr:glycosyltransferase family 39 protein [candidate division KSB1 bacterium]